MSKLNDFNRIAPWYDFLKGVVFGSSMLRSEACFLRELPSSGNLLFIGGGSGRIFPRLFTVAPAVRVYYIEASLRMLRRAERNVPSGSRGQVAFIHGTEDNLPPGVLFDGVITNFFLDQFSDTELKVICNKLCSVLKHNSVWLAADFVNRRSWHRLLLTIMYRFFHLTAGVATRTLPAWQGRLREAGLRQEKCAPFYGGFIESCFYRKPGSLTGHLVLSP